MVSWPSPKFGGSEKTIDSVAFPFSRVHPVGKGDHFFQHAVHFGPNGHALLQYWGDKISPARAVGDLDAAAAGKAVTAGDGTIVPVAY